MILANKKLYNRQEVKIFRAKMSLLLKIVEGSNTAMYLPAQGLMRFLLPQLPGSEYNTENSSDVRFLEVDIPMPPERMASEVFSFTDKVWDELETAQGIIDETLYNESQVVNMGNEASENIVYTPVTVDEIPASANYQNKVNDTFFDSVERINYKIEAVCASSVHGNDKLFFKYVKVPQNTLSSEIGGEERLEMEANECDYSPCDELLTADWVTWSSDQEEWIQCCSCNKWRKIPKHSTSEGVVKLKDLPDDWTCGMAGWLEGKCEVPEEEYSNTVSITEAINGLPVANNVSTSEDGRQHTAGDVSDDSVPINNSHQSDTVNDNQEAPQQNDEVAETDTNIVYTVDLPTAVRNIISSLKSNIGNKLLTRLSPETTQSILTMATQH